MYWKLAFAGIRHRRSRAAAGALLIAISLAPVLIAMGLGERPAVAHLSRTERVLRPVFRRFAPAFLIACAAIAFSSASAHVRAREHEFGVLRSLGASKAFVAGIVLTESAAISLAGALLAILAGHGVLTGLSILSGATPPYAIGFQWCLVASATVVGAAMSGSVIPCAVSMQQDVLDLLEWDR